MRRSQQMSQKKKKTLVRDIIYSFVFVTDGGGAHPHASIFMGEIKKIFLNIQAHVGINQYTTLLKLSMSDFKLHYMCSEA